MLSGYVPDVPQQEQPELHFFACPKIRNTEKEHHEDEPLIHRIARMVKKDRIGLSTGPYSCLAHCTSAQPRDTVARLLTGAHADDHTI